MLRSEPSPVTKSVLHDAKSVFLLLSLLCGMFGFFFFIWKMNFKATSSCLALVSVCALYLHLTCNSRKGTLHESYSYRRFKFIFILAVVIGVSQLVASVFYAVLGSLNNQRFNFDNSYYAGVIPSSIASLWSFLLAYESRYYMKELNTEISAE